MTRSAAPSPSRPVDSLPEAWVSLIARPSVVVWIGLGMTGLGAVAIAAPQAGQVVIGALAGWLLWLAGALMLPASLLLLRGKARWGGLASSVVAIAAGAYLLFNPGAGALAAALLALAYTLTDGVAQFALALALRPLKVWRWVLASALASGLAAATVGIGALVGWPGAFGAAVGLAVMTTGLALLLAPLVGRTEASISR